MTREKAAARRASAYRPTEADLAEPLQRAQVAPRLKRLRPLALKRIALPKRIPRQECSPKLPAVPLRRAFEFRAERSSLAELEEVLAARGVPRAIARFHSRPPSWARSQWAPHLLTLGVSRLPSSHCPQSYYPSFCRP